MEKITHPALRYHGAKFRLFKWISQYLPDHKIYVEPFGGSAGILLQKPRSYAEVYNDLDGDIVNFFRVLREQSTRFQLIEALHMTPYSRSEFEQAWQSSDNPIEQARRTAIRAQMGFGSAGATKKGNGFRIDTKRAYGTAQSLWTKYPEVLQSVGKRFTGVLIENRPAVEVLIQHDAPDTLHFIDPPYVPATRVNNGSGYYRHDMTAECHIELIEVIKTLKGMVILCGYPNDLYNDHLRDFSSYGTKSRISAHRGTALRDERIWINDKCSQALEQQSLFA